MTSIVVVTKRAGLTLTMQSPGHHYIEVRPAAGWLDRSWTEDVLVLDLEAADVALEAIESLRTAGVDSPVIMVANDTDGWDEVIAVHTDLFLVSLPISPTSLLSTVDRAARANRSSPLAAATATAHSLTGTRTEEVVAPELPRPLPEVLEPVVPAPAPPEEPVAKPAPTPRPTVPAVPPVATSPARTVAPATPAPSEPETTSKKRRDDPISMVRTLQEVVGHLSRLHEVAELLRRRCTDAVTSEASAVLVPDGEVWRVSAGAHLRPLEERLQITADHWLITEIVRAGHGVLIRDTDVARTRLSGAPLASWPNLMALPIREVDALVLLARKTKPFGRGDLTKGSQAIGQAAIQLKEAFDVRSLARALATFVDPVD